MNIETSSIAHRIAQGIGYLTHDEVELIKSCAMFLPSHATCVNIGAGAGTSIIALLEARPEFVVYSVDINPENGMAQFIEADVLSHVVRVIGDSKAVTWNGDKIDWLFVDGDHEYAGLLGDMQAWLPRLNDGALVLFHDYESLMWSSVKELVNDLPPEHYARIALQDHLIVLRYHAEAMQVSAVEGAAE